MRKNLLNIFYAAVAILATLSCSQEEPSGKFKEGEAPLYFLTKSAEIEQTTTKAADDAMWVAGMKVAVMIDGQIKPYEVSEINSSITNEALLECSAGNVPFYWNSTTEQKVVTAWAPYSESDTEYPISVKVRADQSKLENYIASNHILACDMSGGAPTAANRPGGQTVTYSNPTLSFTHRTAKIRVNLSVKEGESLDLDGAVVELLNVADSTIICYNASENGTYKYSALIPEVNLASGRDFIKVTLKNGITYVGKSSSATLFKENTQNIFTVTLEDRGAAIELESIEAWAQGETIDQSITVGNGYRSVGDGNSRVYYVTNSDGLYAWLSYVIDAGYNGADCVLLEDITLLTNPDGSSNWRIVESFEGTFDGNGHTINNLQLVNCSNYYIGFVGSIGRGGVIKNLTLGPTCSIVTTNSPTISSIGSFAGSSFGKLLNCHSYATIRANEGYSVGGLIGSSIVDDATYVKILGSSFSGKMYLTLVSFAGGITGDLQTVNNVYVCNGAKASIVGCYSDGYIEPLGSYIAVGGILGRVQTVVGAALTITGCYSATEINAEKSGAFYTGLIASGYGNRNTTGQWANDSLLVIRYCYWADDTYIGIAYDKTTTDPIDGWYSGAKNIFVKGVQTFNNSNTQDWTTKQFAKRMNSAIQTWNTNNPGDLCNYRYGTKYNIGPLLEEGAPQ